MTTLQRAMLLVGLLIVVALCLMPPWSYQYRRLGKEIDRSAGYHFIAAPPEPNDQSALAAQFGIGPDLAYPHFFSARVDTLRLGIELLAAAGLTAFCVIATKRRPA